MTAQDLDKIQVKIGKIKVEEIQVKRDVEHVKTEWKGLSVESIEGAKEKESALKEDVKKLESREEKLLDRLETEFDWKNL